METYLLALLAEKAWILRELGYNRDRLHRLSHRRSGLVIIGQRFCAHKLGLLLQDIARAKLEQLRILSFVEYIERTLYFVTRRRTVTRTAYQGEISLGSLAAPALPGARVLTIAATSFGSLALRLFLWRLFVLRLSAPRPF